MSIPSRGVHWISKCLKQDTVLVLQARTESFPRLKVRPRLQPGQVSCQTSRAICVRSSSACPCKPQSVSSPRSEGQRPGSN
ncbi:uncharacterized protein BDZ83DRAFT_614298 [Colletotrichum acutatum]|uniref:Uncharacterized protein n=1 Tax=Glomerella acutata TaxID=27357 RepID=A0AAD8UTM2_GLOAC|nr:uncharacterized protein BDZ83DRAFT_614298 [Colletotrichum acutatum]KAK1726909.1 hypothetical protein BDZ83DRAFT_614298 [Colletotrichum acutatum]